MSKELGLSIGPVSELQVMKPFFVTLDLPYSLTYGEAVPLNIAVYNYHDHELDVQLRLELNPDFEIILSPPKETLSVPSQEIRVLSFVIKPLKLGSISILVSAMTIEGDDNVQRMVLVEPPGSFSAPLPLILAL